MDYSPPESHANTEAETTPHSASSAVLRALHLVQSDEFDSKLQAARDIRRLTKTSRRCRCQLAEAVGPLVSMLQADSLELNEAALLALLNLAVKDETYFPYLMLLFSFIRGLFDSTEQLLNYVRLRCLSESLLTHFVAVLRSHTLLLEQIIMWM